MLTKKAETILIVEDDTGIADLEQLRLERAGFDVVKAAHAEEAMARLEQTRVGLVVLDYRLPGNVDGLAFYDQMQSAGFKMPVILVTAFGDESTMVKALRAGISDYVSKSLEYLDYLPQAVDRVLEHVRQEHRYEAQKIQAQKMEGIGVLAGGIAHDFNNLLTVILGHTELLRAGLDCADPRREGLAEIRKAADRAALLTHQLLAVSRRQILSPRELDMNALVGRMTSALKDLLGPDIDLAMNLQADLGYVKADADQVQQAIFNLATNACDAMPTGGRLLLETWNVELDCPRAPGNPGATPGSYVVLAISDTGCGMDEATRDQLFQPFFTTKPVGKGIGLGLATAYGIVKQSGGHIDLQTELGKGTTFTIYLPRVRCARSFTNTNENLFPAMPPSQHRRFFAGRG